MKIALIIQARMGSERLPGKVMQNVLDRPLLGHLLDRMLQVKGVDVIVATTDNPEEKSIVDLCRSMGISIFLGDADDVLSRYVMASEGYDVVIRVTGDCPLLDAAVVEEVLKRFSAGKFDYVSNTIERTYPRGYDVEVLTRAALLQIDQAARGIDREHVTSHLVSHHDDFLIDQAVTSPDYSSLRLTVDTIEDFELVKRIIESLPEGFRLQDVIQLLEKHPYLKELNQHIKQKDPHDTPTV